jgi:hypothetical protein
MLAWMRVRAGWDIFTRDAITSALYVSIVLLTALVALPEEQTDEPPLVASAILATAVGLVLAHWFAFRVAAALFDGLGRAVLMTGLADVLAGLLVGVVAALASLISTQAALLVLVGVIGGTGYAVGHRAGASPMRSLVISATILAFAAAVITVKIVLDD